MSEQLCLAPLLESYFRRRLAKQRNATPATMASYRDALRMLILFAAGRLGKCRSPAMRSISALSAPLRRRLSTPRYEK
jgi:integrase/recombinase XerD